MGSANYNTGGVVCLIVRSFKVVRATSVNECTLLSTLALIVAAGEDTSMHMMRAHRPRHFFRGPFRRLGARHCVKMFWELKYSQQSLHSHIVQIRLS